MNAVLILAFSALIAGIVYGGEKPAPIWVSAKNKAIVKIVNVSSKSDQNRSPVSIEIKAEIVSDLTKNWNDQNEINVSLPIPTGWITADTDPWSLKNPQVGDKFLVLSNKSIVDLKSIPISKVLVTDQQIDDILAIIKIESLQVSIEEKSKQFSQLLQKKEKSSNYLWQYFHYLVVNEPKSIAHLIATLSKLPGDYDSFIYVCEMMSEFGHMGQLTPELRKVGKETMIRYLAANLKKPLSAETVNSMKWVTKFDGTTAYTDGDEKELAPIKDSLMKANLEGVPSELLYSLCK